MQDTSVFAISWFAALVKNCLSWLVDGNCFHIESDYNALSHDKARKCIAVAEMIISLHKNNFTPFNLGLVLERFRTYPVRNARHFSLCYLMVCGTGQKLSHFSVRSTNTKCMKDFPLDRDFIQEGADNIDLNTETIDGKNTMHSMARAVFQVVQDHTPTSEMYLSRKECKTLQFLLMVYGTGQKLSHFSVRSTTTKCMKGFN
jgi:hypothetical protein